jgi:ACS family sodium-dependent inorganic phosphate cotransporter
VLGFGVIWWSIATIATPIAARIGLPALLFVRACMGVGEVSKLSMENCCSQNHNFQVKIHGSVLQNLDGV